MGMRLPLDLLAAVHPLVDTPAALQVFKTSACHGSSILACDADLCLHCAPAGALA